MFSRSMFDAFDDMFPPFGRFPLDNHRRQCEDAVVEPLNDNEEVHDSSTTPVVEEPDENVRRPSSLARASRDPFGIGSMFSRAEEMFETMFDSNVADRVPPSVCYSSTTTTRSSNGVTETRRTVRNSEGKTKSVHSRAIGDRAVELIQEDDGRGSQTETRNLIGIADDDAGKFDSEWDRVARGLPDLSHRHRRGGHRMLENRRQW
ncbi:hypothetical protein J8273_6518 [Carpediemonas membranifera]|uniref:Uncharacterized protein n=1 Tax=Carpediemonas membranifera TaxID=201153 RepID=A0A8J6B2S4_9EUKA|nr:hypothetical protein J8273_6518 [Carpediemonas membranifera]|eukprot:KAG9391742.1 hypothetical protein J8273_6518 [Carpediemonas membranifera]